MATKRNYLLDTSVCLSDSDAIFKFDNHDLFLPLKVLEEVNNVELSIKSTLRGDVGHDVQALHVLAYIFFGIGRAMSHQRTRSSRTTRKWDQ